jgi:hypothetical protein
MADKQDKLQLLKAKYNAQLREHQAACVGIKTKLALLDELEAEADNLESAPAKDGIYSDAKTGLVEAVFDAIQGLAPEKGVPGSKIAKYLLSEGFKPKGKNFKTSVGITLKRLSEQNRISTELKEGKRLYMMKK